MKVTQTSHAWREPQTKTYITDITDIKKVAAEYGITDDTIRLYDDNDTLVAVASWFAGASLYHYCTNPVGYPPHWQWTI